MSDVQHWIERAGEIGKRAQAAEGDAYRLREALEAWNAARPVHLYAECTPYTEALTTDCQCGIRRAQALTAQALASAPADRTPRTDTTPPPPARGAAQGQGAEDQALGAKTK